VVIVGRYIRRDDLADLQRATRLAEEVLGAVVIEDI
jgi:hypothetical protein